MQARSLAIRCLAAVGLMTTALQAQEKACGPDEQVPWWPRRVFDTYNATSASERAAMGPVLSAVEALVRKTSYGTPRGFAVRPAWSAGWSQASRTGLQSYEFGTVILWACSIYDEHGSDLTVTFNPNPQSWSEGDRPMEDENGDGLYFERVRSEPLFGATATYGHFEEENTEGLFVLFTAGGESPTVPVTQEEYLRALILLLEGKNQEKVKKVLEFASKTQYQRWLEDAPARKKRHEEMLLGIAQVDPSKVAEVRADLEKADRVAGETLKKEEPLEREQLDKAIAGATAPGDKLRAQIAAMTSAERASPAWAFGGDLVPAGAPNANAVVRIRPAFYRNRTSRVEVHAILVRMPGARREMKALHHQLFREFDWAALKRMVNP
jgi:hypothetical protein